MAVAVAAALAGCSHEDKTFGSSFDACVLQNATRSGDSRNKAEEICARHFNRAPTELDASLASGNAKIVTLKPAPAPPAADNTTGPWTEYSNAVQEGDTIHASVDNKTSDDVIKKVHIGADFYDGSANADGQFVGRKHLGSLYWDLNAADEVTSCKQQFAPPEVDECRLSDELVARFDRIHDQARGRCMAEAQAQL